MTRRRISDTAYFEHYDSGLTVLRWNLPHGTKLVDMAHPDYPSDAMIYNKSLANGKGGLPAYARIMPDTWGFVVSTRGTNGNGGTRHRRFKTLAEAETAVLRWADRRFRFPDTEETTTA